MYGRFGGFAEAEWLMVGLNCTSIYCNELQWFVCLFVFF